MAVVNNAIMRRENCLTDQRTILAARNNADLCAAVCRTHGEAGELHRALWINRGKVPRFYPNAVTLSPDAASTRPLLESLCAAISGEIAIKDSFRTLELESLGLHVLFEARWICRESSLVPSSAKALPCRKIARSEFAQWERAWSDYSGGPAPAVFLPSLMDDERFAFIAAFDSGRIVAGALANRSDQVVGLSNVFGAEHRRVELLAGILGELSALFPGMAVVDYESGHDLDAFIELGFETVGSLRVWIRR